MNAIQVDVMLQDVKTWEDTPSAWRMAFYNRMYDCNYGFDEVREAWYWYRLGLIDSFRGK